MKKFFSIICVLLVSCFLFAGCGVSGSNTLESIRFTRQIFYVDENCPTEISYNVYPSTANNFGKASISTSTQIIGTLVDGVVTADNKFSQAIFTVNAGGKTDSCFVVKKEYPKALYLGHSNAEDGKVLITSGSTTALKLNGRFENEWVASEDNASIALQAINDVSEQTKRIDQQIFNISLVSSDPSIVEVVDSNKLQIRGKAEGSATITAYLADDGGNLKTPASLNSSITINVISQAKEILVYTDSDGFIDNSILGKTITNSTPLYLYAFVKDINDNFITNAMALRLLDVNILTAKNLAVSTTLFEKFGIACVRITISSSDNINTTWADKLLINCENVLCGDGAGLNSIVALGENAGS